MDETRALVLAHVSDLHVSEFGDTFHDRLRIVKRTTNPAAIDPAKFEVAWEEAGWRVLHEIGKRRAKIMLVDPDGYAHGIPGAKESGGMIDPVERAAAKALRLESRRAPSLARSLPSPPVVKHLFEATPKNANVRLLRAIPIVEEANVDAVVITGDITDDGAGFELVSSAFARWRDKGMLFAIPGNHDLFLFPMRGSNRPRPTHESKRAAWQAFAASIGLDLDPCGAWKRIMPEHDTAIVGLDSCARPQRRFFRQNGGIGPVQLEWLRTLGKDPAFARCRHKLALLHHHVVPLPHGVGKKPPSEIGMRLDDAQSAAAVFDEVGITAVLHGHRHISEQRQPAGSNFTILSTPSLTLGCRSGDDPSFWRIELAKHLHAERVRIPVDAVDQDDDPPASVQGTLVDSVVDLADLAGTDDD